MLFRGVLTCLITLIVLSAITALRPTLIRNVNHLTVRGPNVNLPPSGNCHTLRSCESSEDCAICGGNYQCASIAKDSVDIMVNDHRVPGGKKWCLKQGVQNVQCDKKTGKLVYTRDHGWICTCLYPDLYGGPDCSKRIACGDNGKLVNRFTGNTWNGDDSPYATDSKNRPTYRCQCNGINSVRLPADPYRCHHDPCTTSDIKMWNPEKKRCECANELGYAYSKETGKCVKLPTECQRWDPKTKRCVCPENKIAVRCKSEKDNPLCRILKDGWYCKDPCEGYCKHGGKPTKIGRKCHCECKESERFIRPDDRCETMCYKQGVLVNGDEGKKCCSNSHTWVDAKGRKRCGPSPWTVDSCFIAGSQVTMADGRTKSIEFIQVGDVVLDADGEPTPVVLVDIAYLGNRDLIGFNGIAPFVTEDHCFVNAIGCNRLTFNCKMALASKHWQNVKSIKPENNTLVTITDGERKVIYAEDITRDPGKPTTKVYDVITKSHTLVVNGIAVYDDMPEVENHPFIAVILARILKYSKTTNIYNVDAFATRLYAESFIPTLIELENDDNTIMDLFQEEYSQFISIMQQVPELLAVASRLWALKFEELYNLEQLTLHMMTQLTIPNAHLLAL